MKKYQEDNVLVAAKKRINYLLDHFAEDEVWLSLSGGKDSTLCFYLLEEELIKRGINSMNVMIVDLEGHYKDHIDFTQRLLKNSKLKINGYWICLPFQLSNASSMYQPKWLCWDPDEKDKWIREYPDIHILVNEDNNPFGDFFRKGMEFEEFIINFPKFLVEKKGLKKVGQIIGIRTDESYNRYLKMKIRQHREFYNGIQWMLKQKSTGYDTYSVHPVYDWKVSDVWKYLYDKDYTNVYDKMYQIGYNISEMRICQPYGEEQRNNLDAFAKLEPETWNKIQTRVQGGNFARIYKGKHFIKGRIRLPKKCESWGKWTRIILNSMPPYLRDHYIRRINVFLRWWRKELFNDISSAYAEKHDEHESYDKDGLYVVNIHDEHESDTKKLVPSWRRIAKVLIKGDYLCKNLTFTANKHEYEKLLKLKDKYEQQ